MEASLVKLEAASEEGEIDLIALPSLVSLLKEINVDNQLLEDERGSWEEQLKGPPEEQDHFLFPSLSGVLILFPTTHTHTQQHLARFFWKGSCVLCFSTCAASTQVVRS